MNLLTDSERINIAVRNIPVEEPVRIFGAGDGEESSSDGNAKREASRHDSDRWERWRGGEGVKCREMGRG